LIFPIPAEQLIPHRPPLCLIDHLLAYDGVQGVVESTLLPGSICLREDGSLEQAALVELVAQSFAAVKGYGDLQEGKTFPKGFLVGVKQFTFQGTALANDRLLITITRTGETDEFALAEGRVTCGEKVLAFGNVMVWIPREG
jgi:predicted hotdog family 3-hydroxylacyl-ACP dehydratase